jgi:hypothetical protein
MRLVALLLAGPGAAQAIDPKTALDALRFPGDTLTRVGAGRFAEVALPTISERDLNVGIAFLVAKQSPAALARTVREERRVLHADPNVIAYGDFEGEGTLAELKRLRLTPAQLKAFAQAAPGEEINLSLDEIAALHAAGADAHAIENAVRAVLLARYRAKGLAGIAPYARAGSATSAGDELAAVNRSARASHILSPTLYDLLDHYPDDLPPDFTEKLFWVQFRAHGEDTVALEHIFQATFEDTAVQVQRQYYVSTATTPRRRSSGSCRSAPGRSSSTPTTRRQIRSRGSAAAPSARSGAPSWPASWKRSSRRLMPASAGSSGVGARVRRRFTAKDMALSRLVHPYNLPRR